MITLDDAKATNVLTELDNDHIVIGQVYDGLDVLDKMNKLIVPYAGRSYPNFIIKIKSVHVPKKSCKRPNRIIN